MDDVIGVVIDITQECKQKTLFLHVEILQIWMAKVLLCTYFVPCLMDFNYKKSDKHNSR